MKSVVTQPLAAQGLSYLDAGLSRPAYYTLAVLLSLGYALLLFPLDFILGTAGFWFDTRTDPTQHITGLWAFVHDDWRFPLLHTQLLNWPEGVSVAFTDSIPLAALLFKPIASWLPPGSHYFGVWVLLCYVGQGAAGATAAAVLGKRRSVAAVLAGALLAVMMPSLMIRIPHAALLAQGLIIMMLTAYVLLGRGDLSAASFTRWGSVLLLAAAFIHPYLLAMLYPLYAVALASRWRRQGGRWLVRCVMPLPLLLAVLYVLGYFSTGGGGIPKAEVGYDIASMNLLSPFLGSPLATSVLLPQGDLVLDATGMQIDGHNMLGVGLLAGLVYLLVRYPGEMLKGLRRHWLLALLMAGFTLYALTNRIFLGDRVLVTYPLWDVLRPITQTFRGAGRFFWPVGYGLLLVMLWGLLTRAHPFHRLLLLCLVLVQFVDTQQHRAYLAEAASREPSFVHGEDIWHQRVAEAKVVHLFPPYGCGASGSDTLFLQYFTSLHGVPFNSGFVARVQSDCDARHSVLAQRRQPGELMIFLDGYYSRQQLQGWLGDAYGECQHESIGLVCQITEAE